jgi:hypothetical protein
MLFKIFARIEWKDTSKNPTEEVLTVSQSVSQSVSQNDLDLVRGLRKSGRALIQDTTDIVFTIHLLIKEAYGDPIPQNRPVVEGIAR